MSNPEKVRFASVLLDNALDRPLDYEIPEEFLSQIAPGMRIEVPVRGHLKKGTVIALKSTPEVASVQKLASLLSEKPLLTPPLFKLAEWMASYYCTSLRRALKCFLPAPVRGKTKHKEQLLISSLLSQNALASTCEELRLKLPGQAAVLDIILQHPKGVLLTELLEQSTRSPIDTLIKKKILFSEKVQIDRSPLQDATYFPTKAKTLNEEQKSSLAKIEETVAKSEFAAHLLFGVTGSGKTEVYLQAIDTALKMQKGVIFLVPEIMLTAQTVERLHGRFQENVAILHHRLSEGERHDSWHKILEGKVRIVIGARSALFCPVANLGLIIVDEEHEGSYKQGEEAPAYQARDVAVMRAKMENATVVLGSATPSLESYHNAQIGKYNLLSLQKRVGGADLAPVTLIDMRLEFAKSKGFTLFSDELITRIKKRIELGEQTLLFLNRRGYHTSSLCSACGHVIQCPHCDVSLTFHLGENILACHLCDFRLMPPRSCPQCQKDGPLKYKGAGTEMCERALHAILPGVRTLRLDADTTRHKGSHDQIFKQFRSGKADVLIGTQMVAKGLHFPTVTLVGVLNADATLNIPDFRATENAFQLITQVAGRSGRGALAGEVIVQTHLPDHEMLLFAARQDFEGFFRQEIEVRKLFDYPPFTHLAKLLFSGPSEQETLQTTKHFRSALMQKLPSNFELMPAIPCGHTKIKDNFRFQFLIKGKSIPLLSKKIQELQRELPLPSKVRLFVDIDPQSTY